MKPHFEEYRPCYADIHSRNPRPAQGIGRLQIPAASPNKPDARNCELEKRGKLPGEGWEEKKDEERKEQRIGKEEKKRGSDVTRPNMRGRVLCLPDRRTTARVAHRLSPSRMLHEKVCVRGMMPDTVSFLLFRWSLAGKKETVLLASGKLSIDMDGRLKHGCILSSNPRSQTAAYTAFGTTPSLQSKILVDSLAQPPDLGLRPEPGRNR